MVCLCTVLHLLDLASDITSVEQEEHLGNNSVARYS